MVTTAHETPAADAPPDVEPDGNTMHVYRSLRAAILDGTLEPGASMSQVKLAAGFGISRSPLREALRLLQHEGLVVGVHNRRMRIAPLTVEDLEQLYALRVLAEPLAVRVTVGRLDEEGLAAIVQANAGTKRALKRGDAAALHEPHRRFHMGLCAGAGQRLRTHVEDLWDFAERYRQLTLAEGTGAAALSRIAIIEHDAITEAAIEGDAAHCATLVVQHLMRVGTAILALLDSSYDPITLRMALSRELEALDLGKVPAGP